MAERVRVHEIDDDEGWRLPSRARLTSGLQVFQVQLGAAHSVQSLSQQVLAKAAALRSTAKRLVARNWPAELVAGRLTLTDGVTQPGGGCTSGGPRIARRLSASPVSSANLASDLAVYVSTSCDHSAKLSGMY